MGAATFRPLPTRVLPAALLREPRGLRRGGDEEAAALAAVGGVRVGEDLLAFLPAPGRPETSATAAAWAFRQGEIHRANFPGVLIFPGIVEEKRQGWQAESSPLLEASSPSPKGQVLATGYVAAWLKGTADVATVGRWDLEKGRSLPLARLQTRREKNTPMRNAEVLGRRIETERPELAAAIELHLAETGALRLTGALGVGKTHAAWSRARRESFSCWVDVGRELPGSRLAALLGRALGDPHLDPADDPERLASRLIDRLAHRRGEQPLLVIDDAHLLDPQDRALLQLLVPVAAADRLARFLVIEPSGSQQPWHDALPTVVVERFGEAGAASWAKALTARLELPPALAEAWAKAAGGSPWAFEELLHAQIHLGGMRRVFGSFFYAGAADAELQPSQRFAASVAAALPDRDLRLAMLLLAVAEENIQPTHLIEAAAPFGVDLPWGFEEALLDADLVQIGPGGGLQFVVPAMGKALASSLRADGVVSLRHALGGVLAESGSQAGLSAYRMLAGSREALPTLLDYGRDTTDRGSREEVYNALYTEYHEHRGRFGDIGTELEILWVLLPLARRLGCLARLERELDRAVELAEGDSQRLVALVALRAEHDQDRGRGREAELGFRAALATSEGLDENRRAVLLTRLGALLHRQGRTGEARDIFESLLEVVDRDQGSALGATCLFFLGNIALAQGRWHDAAALHGRAAATRRARGGSQGALVALAASLTAQGTVAMALGDYAAALRFAEEAQQTLARGDTDPDQLGFALLCRGRALARLGDLTGGLRDFRRVVELRQGRDDVAGESLGRLEHAQVLLQLGQPAKALDEARRAHFFLTLGGQSSLLGDAERLIARIAFGQGQLAEAAARLAEAVAVHRRQHDEQALLFDRAFALQLALHQERREEVVQITALLGRALDQGVQGGEIETLDYWVYRGYAWLERHGVIGQDPMIYLRRAYQEVLRKANFLEPGRRHAFLYQIAEHQAILDAATEREITLPVMLAHEAS